MKILHIGCMSGENGFTSELKKVCDEFEEIPVSHPHLNERIQQVAIADLVFIQIQAEGITGESLLHLKSLGAWICNWSGDVRSPLPQVYPDMAKHVDITCFSNMVDVEEMRRLGFKSDFLQIGYDPEIYRTDGNIIPNTPEIVFMGNNFDHFPLSQYRRDMVRFLQDTYGSRFGVYGIGWGTESYMGNQLGEAAIYRSAKIGINLSHFNYDRYTSDRMFRMMGCGIYVMSHNYIGIGKDFYNSCSAWNNFGHLKDLIDVVLANDKIRQLASEKSYQLALNNFTFRHMCENIIKLYNER